jgi:hypothetical protein
MEAAGSEAGASSLTEAAMTDHCEESPMARMTIKNTFIEAPLDDDERDPLHVAAGYFLRDSSDFAALLIRPPLDFLGRETSEQDAERIQVCRESYQTLKAIPGLDYISQSREEIQRALEGQTFARDRKMSLDESVKPRSTSDVLSSMVHVHVRARDRAPSLNRVPSGESVRSSRYQTSSAAAAAASAHTSPEQSNRAERSGTPISLDRATSPLERETKATSFSSCSTTQPPAGSFVSVTTCSSLQPTRQRKLLKLCARLDMEALEALRKDYQELRAVPGLDCSLQHSSLLHDSEEMYPISAAMKVQRTRKDSGQSGALSFGPALSFMEDNTELQAIREAYQTDLRPVRGLDYWIAKEASSVASERWEPKSVNPSSWLVGIDSYPASKEIQRNVMLGPPLALFESLCSEVPRSITEVPRSSTDSSATVQL